MNSPKRYHPVLVTLHWLMILLVVTNLYLGIVVFEDRGGGRGDLQSANTLVTVHMVVGVALLVLLFVRLIVRMATKAPPPVTAGNRLLDMVAGLVHGGLYVTILAVTVLGLVFSLQSGRFQSAFLGAPDGFPGSGETPPRDNSGPAGNAGDRDRGSDDDNSGPGSADDRDRDDDRRGSGRGDDDPFDLLEFHELAAYALLGLASLHILAALFHQIILRDNLIGRMWYGER